MIARLQRSVALLAPTWADGPGFCISRLWRWKPRAHNSLYESI